MLTAGSAAEGTLFTLYPDPRDHPEAAALATRLDKLATRLGRPGMNLAIFTAYAAVQAWAQAVEEAGTFDTEAVAEALRSHEFETVLGTIGFNEKGDVTGYDTFVWYIWTDREYVPLEERPPSD